MLARFILQACCRVFHGHIMTKFGADKGSDGRPRSWYMCARCLRCEFLYDVPEIAS